MEAITGTLGLNWNGLIWQTINFIVLLILLRIFLYKPVVAMLDAQRASTLTGYLGTVTAS